MAPSRRPRCSFVAITALLLLFLYGVLEPIQSSHFDGEHNGAFAPKSRSLYSVLRLRQVITGKFGGFGLS